MLTLNGAIGLLAMLGLSVLGYMIHRALTAILIACGQILKEVQRLKTKGLKAQIEQELVQLFNTGKRGKMADLKRTGLIEIQDRHTRRRSKNKRRGQPR
jgi:hypothetical protein